LCQPSALSNSAFSEFESAESYRTLYFFQKPTYFLIPAYVPKIVDISVDIFARLIKSRNTHSVLSQVYPLILGVMENHHLDIF